MHSPGGLDQPFAGGPIVGELVFPGKLFMSKQGDRVRPLLSEMVEPAAGAEDVKMTPCSFRRPYNPARYHQLSSEQGQLDAFSLVKARIDAFRGLEVQVEASSPDLFRVRAERGSEQDGKGDDATVNVQIDREQH
ncbi:MAG: hypothetical protein SGCHY_004775, partial [Lobulomycetales sp.]